MTPDERHAGKAVVEDPSATHQATTVLAVTSRLEDLKTGAVVSGIVAGERVTVVQVEWHGADVVNLSYRLASGALRNDLVYAGQDFTVETDEGATWPSTPTVPSSGWPPRPDESASPTCSIPGWPST